MKEKLKILAVDDEPDVRIVLHEALQGRYEVSTVEMADDLEETLDLFEPDLLILDVVMPGTDGIKACRKLRANAKYADLPILFLSGVSFEKHLPKVLSVGADGWLTKPFDAPKLRKKIEEILGARNS